MRCTRVRNGPRWWRGAGDDPHPPGRQVQRAQPAVDDKSEVRAVGREVADDAVMVPRFDGVLENNASLRLEDREPTA